MLATRFRAAFLGTASLALLMASAGAAAADKSPPKKKWEELRDDPVDYSPYEKRRAKNLTLGTSPVTGAFAGGYATHADFANQQALVITDEALTRGLQEQAKALVPERLGIKPPPIEFVVVDDLGFLSAARAMGAGNPGIDVLLKRPEANFMAYATPGGAIVLGLSALKTVKTYDELAFLLGHESSHILYDHHTEEENQRKIGQFLALATVIATLATQRSDQNTQENVAWAAIGLIVAYGVIGPAWDRGQEREADALGYELLLESGRSAEGATNIFDRLDAKDKAMQEYLDVMCGPDTAGERFLKNLLGAVIGIPIPEQGYAPHSAVCAERRNIFAALFKTHPEVSDRRENITKHQQKVYADLPPRPVTSIGDGSVTLLEFLSPSGDAFRLSKAYDGLNAFFTGDLATARMIAGQLKPDSKEVRIPVLELCFRVANADGRQSEAFRCLEQALIAPQASQHLFIVAEQEYVRHQRWADAARVLELAVRKGLATRPQILIKLISYLRAAGDTARVEAALAECKAMNIPGMTLACEATAHPPPGMAPTVPSPPPPIQPPAPSVQTPQEVPTSAAPPPAAAPAQGSPPPVKTSPATPPVQMQPPLPPAQVQAPPPQVQRQAPLAQPSAVSPSSDSAPEFRAAPLRQVPAGSRMLSSDGCRQSDDLEKALRECEKIIRQGDLSKTSLAAYYNRAAEIELKLGRYDDAVEDMENAVRHDPGNSDYEANLAIAKAKAGRQ